MRLSLRYAALSDVGRVRRDNQDSGFASGHLLVIADGVGGAARGDIASSTAVQILRRLDEPAPEDMLEALAGAIHRAHDRIAELVEEDPELEGTSTTVTAALFDGSRIAVGHVGDSRGYLLRGGTLVQLTKDHTFVQSLIDEGRITEDEARTHPHRNLILRAVDGVHEAEPDLFFVDLAPGDRVLLCSDGCSGVLDDARLTDILSTGTADYAVVELVRASLDAGSSDNITCVVADVVDADASPDGEAQAAGTTGPMLVGAAAEQPRRAGAVSRSFFRGHRAGDTGELEPVPGDGDEYDPEELRYAPLAPRRFAWFRRLVLLLVIGLVLWLTGTLAYRWTQQQYYVADDGPSVAIFRGVQAEVPGVRLHQVFEASRVTVDALPPGWREQVRSGIGAQSLADAKGIVSRLTGLARVCPTPKPTQSKSSNATPARSGSPAATASASPSNSPSKAPSKSPSKKPDSGPSGTPSASPSPTPTIAPPDCIEATP